MGKITTLFVRKVIDEIDSAIDKNGLLRSMGIDVAKSPHMIPDSLYYSFFERAAAIDRKGTTLPLRVGASMRCDDYGAFGLAWKSATTLRGSFKRAERYAQVLTSVSTYEVEATDGGAYMHLHRSGERSLGMQLSNEATIASILAISREVSTRTIRPIAVYFKHRAPEITRDHENYFGCPVHFEANRDALLISNTCLQATNILGDEGFSQFFDRHLETELEKLEEKSELDWQIHRYLSHCLSEGIPMLSEVAQHFGMSGRTLQRRLSELGYTYQALVDEARRRLAEQLLRTTEFSLLEIAFMTGFSEQSGFTRSFKRWTGQTPRSFRIQHR